MKKRPKVGVLKLTRFSNGYSRWFGASYDYYTMKHLPKNKRPKFPIIDLNVQVEIRTEKQLCHLLLSLFGPGEFQLFAYRGPKLSGIFWKGIINEEGFLFKKFQSNNKELRMWKGELAKEKQEGDKDGIELTKELIEMTKEEIKQRRRERNYGFKERELIKSSKRGHFMRWDDKEIKFNVPEWDNEQKINKKSFDKWGKIKEVKFEKW